MTARSRLSGRELDALVAEKVMGLAPVEWRGDSLLYGDQRTGGRVPHYSTEIADAWQVVERVGLDLLRTDDGWLAMETTGRGEIRLPEPVDKNHPCFDGFVDVPIEGALGWAVAKTAPRAICLAALKAGCA